MVNLLILLISSGNLLLLKMTELSLKIGNRTITARENSDDLTARSLVEMFTGLLVGHTFNEQTIIDAFDNYVEEA